MYRIKKSTARTAQSSVIATHTPNTPHPSHFPRTKLKKIRKIHIEMIAVTIVYFTSLEALRVLGRVKETGQIVTQHSVWYSKIFLVMAAVSGDR